MIRVACVLVLLACAGVVRADDKKVAIRFLGGAKKAPLDGLKVTVRGYTGDWTADRKNKLKDGTSDKNGTVAFALAPGRYYIDIASDKELPYLPLPVGHKGRPGHSDRTIKVGADAEQSFDFHLADACKLVLRAVDADTGKPLPGVVFVTESETAEDWGISINGDNIGAEHGKADEATDKDGYFTRLLGPREGYTYFAWPPPKGYEQVGKLEVTVPTPLGKEKAEHTFKFRKKDTPRVQAPAWPCCVLCRSCRP
jgi:hypothetical protein